MPETRQAYWDVIHPEDRERVRRALTNHFESGKPFSEEYRIQSRDGTYINIADHATAIRNRKGSPISLVGSVRDITARKHAEQMKSDFVSFVTHQLRTPLSGIKWMLELATDGTESPEEVESYIQDARSSTDRLIRLVNDLLDVSRLERGKLQISYTNIDLSELTRIVVDEMAPMILEKGQVLSVDAREGLPSVNADAQMLRQAIINLLSNAMKYTPHGGEIKIRTYFENGRVCWQVKDTGIGIPRSDLGRLFEKFYRARNALDVETEGTGLGLYLVKLIVERFGGNVSCESQEGTGSTFSFALPVKA